MAFEEYQLSLMPPSLQKAYGEAWARAFGIMKDAIATGATEATRARYVETAPEDALPIIGAERSLPRLPTETAGEYRKRLLGAWDAWEYAGTRTGLQRQLQLLGITPVIYENHDWPLPAGNWWDFWVFIQQPHPFAPEWYVGDGTIVGDGHVMGVKPAALYAALVQTIKQWRPAHAHLQTLAIVFDGLIVGIGAWTVGAGNTIGGRRIDVSF